MLLLICFGTIVFYVLFLTLCQYMFSTLYLIKVCFYLYTDGERKYEPGGTKDGIIATRSGRDGIFPLCNRSHLISLYTYILLPIFEYFSL